MKNKLLSMGLLVLMAMMYPFSCTPQTGIGVGNGNGCDTVFIENPQLGEFQKELARLRSENTEQKNEIYALNIKNENLEGSLTESENNLARVMADLSALTIVSNNQASQITSLEKDLEDALNKPPVTVTDTIYKEKDYITVAGVEYKVSDIELIRPFEEVDEVVISHCDSTKFTTWYHWGGISGYPHDISMATKEYGMIKIHFKDSLTDEIKVQKSYTLKRTKDYRSAETRYEFIK